MDDLLLMYREKVGHVYAPGEVKSAFENSFAICMDLKGKDLIRLQYKLFLKMLKLNPDIMILDVDCCIMNNPGVIMRKQKLIINKNGTKEISNQLIEIIKQNEVQSTVHVVFSEKKYGVKGSYHWNSEHSHPAILIANLLEDDGHYLLTLRNGMYEKKMQYLNKESALSEREMSDGTV